jgi:DUF971 family protein
LPLARLYCRHVCFEVAMTNSLPWPTELRLVDHGRLLKVSFDDGALFELPAEYLRVESPSAEVRGHAPSQRQVQSGKRHVAVTDIVPTGNYAVRLVFDDTHATGIYTFGYLRELGERQGPNWTAYLEELKTKGLSRDPPGRG